MSSSSRSRLVTEPDWASLDAAWSSARAAGVLGGATTESLIAHAAGFLPAACRVDDEFRGVDLGTGAGLPGVVLAALRPRSRWVLVDANARRCEYAQAAARALGVHPRVSVVHARAEDLGHDPQHRRAYDLVVARSFGPPAAFAECALPLVSPAGRVVVSVTNETSQRWVDAARTLQLGTSPMAGAGDARYLLIEGPAAIPDAWPRRPAARRRSPLF